MTAAEWTVIKAIAADALARTPAERDALLAERCGADAVLRDRVEALLDSVVLAEGLYETPIAVPPAVREAISADGGSRVGAGTRIGAYRIVGEIGRGGMGAAYLAERDDREYDKRVAVKLIKRGMDSDAILRRFREERQILATLDHPNIVMLLDGGTTADGQPYFIMEYVDGLPIDAFCDARALGTQERLSLFRAVCGAVHHAHGHRVIHRDLKASNILVTQAGVPKLLDFGIAKLLDGEASPDAREPTLLGRAMTPQYASPEQVRGEPLTPASDVYSLGVLLYRLLCGSFPYDLTGRSQAEAERAVLEETPLPPSRLVDDTAASARGGIADEIRRQLAGGLDRVALNALAKDRGRRYPSARALADDIGRYLAGQPVLAPRAPSFPRRRLAAALIAASLVLAVAAGVAMTRLRSPAAAASARSVAVLPLVNADGDPELDYLADGITDDVIARLSRASQLKVIGRNSVQRYRATRRTPHEVARELGVDAVVTGSVVQRGGGLSVSAVLIDARSRARLWSAKYDGRLGELQTVQRDIARQVAAGLQLQLTGAERTYFAHSPTEDAEAYQLYLKGRYFLNKRTEQGLARAVTYFSEAIERDAGFALAYSGLADAHGLLSEYHVVPPDETYPKASAAARRALELDGHLAEAHASMGYVLHFYERQPAAAEDAFRRATSLNPTYVTGHQWYAELLTAQGRHDEAIAEIRKATSLDPLSLIVNTVEAWLLYIAGRHDESIARSLAVIDMDPNFPEAYEYLKRGYDATGRYREAIAARQARRALLGRDVTATAALAAAAASADAPTYWRQRLAQEQIEAAREGTLPFEFAEILAQAGDARRAIDWLERACREHDFMTVYMQVAPTLASLASDSRFQQLAQRGCGVRDTASR